MKPVWVALALAWLVYALLLNPQVYFAEDDVLYQFMAKNAAEYGSLFLRNGFEETGSPLFEYMFFYMPVGPRELAPQYPPLYPLLGAPFFALLGTRGLFVFNAFLFIGCGMVLWRIAFGMFRDERIAHASVLIWAMCTFSGALALTALPHTAAVFFILLAFLQAWNASEAKEKEEALTMAALAGIFQGLAIGMRIDSGFALAGTAAPLLLARPLRVRQLFLFGLGFLLPLLIISAMNQIRFHQFTPFSYGAGQKHPIFNPWTYAFQGCVIALALGVPVLWRHVPALRRRRWLPGDALGPVLFAIACLPLVPGYAWNNLPDILWEKSVELNAGGNYEKALLQSSPFLILAPFAYWLGRKRREEWRALYIAGLFPLVYTVCFGVLGFGSNVHIYQRFFSPAMPFFAILCAYAIAWMGVFSTKSMFFAVVCGLFIAAMPFLAGGPEAGRLALYPLLETTLPHAVTLCLGGLALAHAVCARCRLGKPLSLLGAAACAWSAGMLMFRDQAVVREMHGAFAENERAAQYIPPGTLLRLPAEHLRKLPPFLNVPDIKIAMQPRDLPPVPENEAQATMRHFHALGRPLYTFGMDPAALEAGGFSATPVPGAPPGLLRWEAR